MSFIIGRPDTQHYIEKAAFPPRLSVWTTILIEAEKWDNQSEAQMAVDYIMKSAWNVVVLTEFGTSLKKPTEEYQESDFFT